MGLITNNARPWGDEGKNFAVSFTDPTYHHCFIYDDLLDADTVCFIVKDKESAKILVAKLRQAARSLERVVSGGEE